MKKIILITLIILAGLFGLLMYLTRPVEVPEAYIPTEGELLTENQYRISQENSSVSFYIDEDLRGERITVEGKTNEISGIFTLTDTTLSVGEITIDARTFETDSSNRDGAINRLILNTEKNPTVTFTTSNTLEIIDGSFNGELNGSLSLAGKTNPATLKVAGTVNDSMITATVDVALSRSDYGLLIPNIPFVANVPDEFFGNATVEAIAE